MREFKVNDYSDLASSMEELAKQMGISNDEKIEPLEYNGIDVTTSEITATSFGIKDSFTPDKVQYFNEKGYSKIQAFIKSCIHLGIQQGIAIHEDRYSPYMKMIEMGKYFKKLKSERDEEG